MKRKPENEKLPPRVYRDQSRYKYRPYLGRENGQPKYGTPIRLCGLNASISEIWQAYENLTNKDNNTLSWLVGEYLKSGQFKELAGKTQYEYTGYSNLILDFKMKSGHRFGAAPLHKINKRVIRGYLDTYPAKVSANRHVQFLSAVFTWGEERYPIVKSNPCAGVRRNREESRERYIEDWEYAVTYACAQTMRNPLFAPAMELAYLCRARRDEIFSLTERNLKKDGVHLVRGKGSDDEITVWSPRLREAIAEAKKINIKAPIPLNAPRYLMRRKDGGKYTKNALDSAWQRVMKKAKEVGAELPAELLEEAIEAGARVAAGRVMIDGGFTFHDLKAKGYTEAKHHSAGHRSARMHSVYMRKPELVEATK